MIKALVFDFDGLILETEGPIFQSWVELYDSYGLSLSFSTWATTIGTYEADFDPYIDLERQVGRKLDWDVLEPRRQASELSLVDTQPILPGVEACLADARRLGLRIGLASSSTCDWVQGHLSRLGLSEYFLSVRGKEDVLRTKPDPALYLAVLRDLEVLPEQAVALEDSPNGILAAKRAGMLCVAVPNPLTRMLDVSQADLRLESLAEVSLQEILKKLGG